MRKRISRREHYEKLNAACEPFKRAKSETIRTLAGIGRRHRLLRYPIWIILVTYIFVYNVILYGCIQLKVREKFARGVALVTTVALVFTSVNLTVFATTQNDGDGAKVQGVIAAFAELDESVASQSLQVGAGESEIIFPDTLAVTLEIEPKEDTGPKEDAITPEEGAITPEENPTASEEGAITPEESTTTPEENTTASEEGTTTPEEGTVELEESAPWENQGQTSDENTPEDMPTDTLDEEGIPADDLFSFLLPEPMVVHAAESDETGNFADGTEASADVTEVSIDVTWNLDTTASTSDAFDSSKAGNCYVYVAVLPEGYTVAEGVNLPEIMVTVTDTEQTVRPEAELADGGEIALLIRPYDEETSSDMVYYLADGYDSYSWELWTGEDWMELEMYEPELVAGKEEWYAYRFRCIVTKDGVRYTAQAEDDWQIEDSGIMLMAENTLTAANSADSGESGYMFYDNAWGDGGSCYFNVKGKDGDTLIQTTYRDRGYRTASSVDGGANKINWINGGETAMGNSLYGTREISLVYNGRYAKITYQVENRGSATQSFQVGSSADVMIGNNDYAPVVGSTNGLTMSGEPKNSYTFNLVAPTASTLWYGYYGKAYSNMFTNLTEQERSTPYSGDSGMAWSWSDSVAPGQTWSRYVLVGVGELPDAPDAPTLTNSGSIVLQPGTTTTITGTAAAGSTVVMEMGGEEFSGTADNDGNFSVTVETPANMPDGETELNYWAVSPDGGISDVQTITATVVSAPFITLTDSTATVMEDSTLNDAWYKAFIKTSGGTVSHTAIATGTPGTYTVTYTAARDGYTDAVATLAVTVLPQPLALSEVTATRVGSTDSFTLSAALQYPGGEGILETGFVWGIMQNPTIAMNNGSGKTSSVVTAKNGSLSVTAGNIADDVTYYARAYVKAADGNVYYSSQKDFSINGKKYGTFTIENNGNNTFTVTRTDGFDDEQTVYFRTVNGSAVGGTHFTHRAGTLTFSGSETSKTIEITENSVTKPYENKEGTSYPATAYSNADRTYSVEIYRVDGGGTLGGTTSATRSMTLNDNYTVDRNCYVAKKESITKSDNKLINKDITSPAYTEAFTMNRFHTAYVPYLKETAYRYEIHINAYVGEFEDCWEWLRFTSGSETATIKFEIKPDSNLNDWTNGWFPQVQGNTENQIYINELSGNRAPYASQMGLGTVYHFDINDNPIKVEAAVTGSDNNNWTLGGCEQESVYSDISEPQLIGIAPMGNSTYKPGDKATISLIFDEIVDKTNSVGGGLSNTSKITTTWGTFTYAGGADTNVLYFTGTVPANADSSVSVTSLDCASQIKDMCDYLGTSAGGSSGSTMVSVDNTTPTVSIADSSVKNGTATATISGTNISSLKYTWSQNSTMPVTGWLTATNDQTVSTRQTSGTWYLHVLGTYNATGKTAHKYVPFNFDSDTGGSMPELTLSANNSNWAQSRTITLSKTPSDATVTVKTPSGTTDKVNGTSYTATENGSYTFTLTSGEETVVKSITVSKIDQTAPTAEISGPATLTQNENVTLTITPTDAGGSGVKSVDGTWTKTTTGSTATTETTTTMSATLTKNTDGTYSATTPETEGNNNTCQLTVTVTDNAGNTGSASSNTYTVNLKAPTITVTRQDEQSGQGSSNAGDTYSYIVTENGNTITAIQLPDGTITTALSGTFTLTAPGTYYVTVSDEAGHVVRSSAMTVEEGVDGDAPEVRLYQQDESWTDEAQLEVSIYEEGTIASAVWKKEGSSSSTEVSYSKEETSVYSGAFSVTENGTYTVEVTDTGGNVGTASITVSNIDVTAPEVTCTPGAAPNAVSGWYTDSEVPVILSFEDKAGAEDGTPSGIVSVQYKWVTSNAAVPTSGISSLESSDIAEGTYTTTLSGNGTYYLYYKVTDEAGNVKEGFSEQIKKDSYAGTAIIIGPTQGQPVSTGLAMHIKLSYGPSGGCLTAGTSAASAVQLAKMDSNSGTETMTVEADFTTKSSGENDFYFYRYATNGEALSFYDSLWPFYVYQITFNSQGGSDVKSQFVWTTQTSASTSTTVQCAVTEPKAPTCEGYTFGGWYTDAECTDGNQFDFVNQTQIKANTTLYAKWTANTYNVEYKLTMPDGSTYTLDSSYTSYTYGQGLVLPALSQEGYAFCGWYGDADYSGTAYTEIGKTAIGDKTYYGYFQDTKQPEITASIESGVSVSDGGWYNAENLNLSLAYSDNEGVTKLYGKVDDGDFSEINSVSTARGTAFTKDYACTEGVHTYTFKAVDAAGNETTSAPVTVKWDKTKSVIGEITFEQKAANIFDWIIGKKSLIIYIPVTEEGSGADQVSYTIMPESGTAQDKTAEIKDGVAKIILTADWKGSITDIKCTDAAGNVSDTKGITGASNGIIVEDNPPVITILANRDVDGSEASQGAEVSGAYYDVAPKLYVTVKDDADGAVTGGLAFVSWKLGDGSEQPVNEDFDASEKTEYSFTIIALEGKTGTFVVTVKAEDQAGNTAEETVNVHIKEKELAPNPAVDYRQEKLTGLTPGEAYVIGEDALSADGQGCIAIKEDWFDSTIRIYKKGTENTLDSDSAELNIARRPEAPSVSAGNETIKGKKDGTLSGASATMEYSIDDGANWIPVNADGITDGCLSGLASGKILIRVKATDTAPHGEQTQITIAEGKTLTVTFDVNGESIVEPITGKAWQDTVSRPQNPVKEGYALVGWYRDNTLMTVWHFMGETDEDHLTEDVTLYAKWKPNTYTVTLHTDGGSGGTSLTTYTYGTGAALPADWMKTGYSFDGWYDNEDLTGTEVTVISATDIGNKEYWAKWKDDIAPVIGTLVYNYQPKNFWHWLIGKDSLIITVPVTEEGSGADKITYTVTPEGGTVSTQTADIEDGLAKITLSADFKGTVAITCTDKEGNTSDSVTAGADLDADAEGFLIEDHAPEIAFSVNGGEASAEEYGEAPTVVITVKDDKENAISAGLASVTYRIGNGAENALQEDFTAGMKTEAGFTIPKEKIPAGGAEITVRATDNAGNQSEKKLTVSIHTHSGTHVEATEPTCTEEGNKEYYTCTCGKWFSDSGCTDEITDHASVIVGKLGHDFSGQYLFDENRHWKVCSRCGIKDTKHSHIYDNDRDAACNDCSYERMVKNPDTEEPEESESETPKPTEPPEPSNKAPTPEAPQPVEPSEDKPETTPDKQDERQPEKDNVPEDTKTPEQTAEEPTGTQKEQQTEKEGIQNIPAAADNGEMTISGEPVATGNVEGMTDTYTALNLGEGAVIVTVVCEGQEYTAGVADTVAVANAVLTPEQIQLASDGETIEIRVDVTDISDNVPPQDEEIIEDGVKAYQNELPGLTLGMYVDISMFIKIGAGGWNAVTKAEEPIEVVIGIPQELQGNDREFYIIRSHEGKYTLLTDMDEEPDTITISTNLFSAYAIAYEPVVEIGENHKCGLCHICPTFLGICYFVWLAIIIAAFLIIWIVIRRNRKEKEEQEA